MMKIRLTILTCVSLAVLCLSLSNLRAEVTFDWAIVGNPGNAGDVQSQGTFGAVAGTYRISKHEVTNTQYTEFLNAVDPNGNNADLGGSDGFLYNGNMDPDTGDATGGIKMVPGNAVGSKYEVAAGRGNNPVIYTSFFDAMRFTNWLDNGQGSGSTESGVYMIGSGTDETRAASTSFFIPSEDEWYKAAYHKNDGVTGNYWEYPTSTDAVPFSDQPPGSDAPTQSNTANFFKDDSTANGYDDGDAVTGSPTFDNTVNYLTDVGAYTTSLSPYGTFDQGGNVWEWNEAVISSSQRSVRGGRWTNSPGRMAASSRFEGVFPTDGISGVGFRVASVPEPSSLLLVAFGALGLLLRRRR
jgi:sulfatase modifying factor 1